MEGARPSSAEAGGPPRAAPLLRVEAVTRHFRLARTRPFGPRPVLRALDGVDLTIADGEILGLVGESGSGKSTLGRIVMALDAPTSGRVLFRGADLFALPPHGLARLRRGFQMVFQDPYGSLDPRMPIGRSIAEPMHLLDDAPHGAARRHRVREALAEVGLRPEDSEKYPHEFSGGQRQRVAIARALITRPALIVADEPVSALDVSIQAQVLNLILDLRASHGLSYLLITHNLVVVEHVSDRLAVMYLGRVVETGPTREVFAAPAHPYTRALLAAAPRLARVRPEPTTIGEPTPAPARGCAFAPRCPAAAPVCREETPQSRAIAPGRSVACHRA